MKRKVLLCLAMTSLLTLGGLVSCGEETSSSLSTTSNQPTTSVPTEFTGTLKSGPDLNGEKGIAIRYTREDKNYANNRRHFDSCGAFHGRSGRGGTGVTGRSPFAGSRRRASEGPRQKGIIPTRKGRLRRQSSHGLSLQPRRGGGFPPGIGRRPGHAASRL